jgi:glucose-6-phosphate dehydrogenase assembly protein OpcA
VKLLCDLSDLVLVDSARVGCDILPREHGCNIADLVWPRLTPWRSALGHFLTTCELIHPDRLDRVEIVGDPAGAHIFAGWLAHLLRWRVGREADRPTLATAGGDRVELEVRNSDGGVRGLQEFSLRSGAGPQVRISAAGSSGLLIQAEVEGAAIRSRTSVPEPDLADEVARLVHTHGTDPVYRRARALAQRMFPAGPGRP